MSCTFLLPVRVAKRELDGRLLLGLVAASRGHQALIGPEAALLAHPEPGIFLNHTMRVARAAEAAAAMGHAVVALDEEGLVRFPDALQQSRMDETAFRTPRLLFAWGASNADYWRSLPQYPGTPIAVTGNPRGDLLRPEALGFHAEAVQEIRARFGRFVLLNTNFSFVNHFDPAFYAGAELPDGVVAHKRALFGHFLDLVPALARAIAPTMLVVRPHPSESHEPWQAAATGADNVVVAAEGSVVPWLIAAEAVVHNGCTSAVEAAILKRPVVAFRPVADAAYDLELPNRLSFSCPTQRDTLQAVSAVLDGTARFASDADVLAHNVAGLDGPLACERMLDAIEAHGESLLPAGRTGQGGRLKAWARQRVEALARQVPVTTRLKYVNHLLAEFNDDAIADKAGALKKAFGRFDGISISPHAGLVHIGPSGKGAAAA